MNIEPVQKRYEIHRLGHDYYGLCDTRTELYVSTASDKNKLIIPEET